MKFASILTLATLAYKASAATVPAQLAIESNNDLNDKKLYSIHEGAAINYVFVGNDNGQEFQYDQDNQKLTYQINATPNPINLSLGALDEFVSVAVTSDPVDITFDNNYLKFNGSSDNFYACKNLPDPYGYSKSSPALTFQPGSQKGDCEKVQVKLITN